MKLSQSIILSGVDPCHEVDQLFRPSLLLHGCLMLMPYTTYRKFEFSSICIWLKYTTYTRIYRHSQAHYDYYQIKKSSNPAVFPKQIKKKVEYTR